MVKSDEDRQNAVHQDKGSEGIEDLLAKLEARLRRRKYPDQRDLLLLMLGVYAQSGIVLILFLKFPLYYALLLFIVSVFTATNYAVKAWPRFDRRTIKELLKHEDLRIVGPLAVALFETDATTARAILVLLSRLLPRLKANDTLLLNTHHRNALHKSLGPSTGGMSGSWRDKITIKELAEYRIALFTALEQVGDAAAIPNVEKWANRHPINTGDREIIAAAKGCLPFLQQRAEQTQGSNDLLRSSGLDTRGETLLRATMPSVEAPSKQLLRPVAPEGEESRS